LVGEPVELGLEAGGFGVAELGAERVGVDGGGHRAVGVVGLVEAEPAGPADDHGHPDQAEKVFDGHDHHKASVSPGLAVQLHSQHDQPSTRAVSGEWTSSG